MQFYIYDFTELLAPEKIPELLEAGHFDDYHHVVALAFGHGHRELSGFQLLAERRT